MIVTIFRSRLNAHAQDDYRVMAKHMSEFVRTIPGYISHKVFVAEDGERATLVEFESEEGLLEWKHHPEHMEAKKLGFTEFFSAFNYQICSVLRTRAWQSKTTRKEASSAS